MKEPATNEVPGGMGSVIDACSAGSCPALTNVTVYRRRSPTRAGLPPVRLATIFVDEEKSGANTSIAVVTTPGK